MPMRSATIPTNGTLSPPLPQAKPIISDDTVAALTGASACPNVTLTGSVDCRKNPPTATSATKTHPWLNDARNRNGTAQISDRAMIRRAPYRSAAGPPRNPPIPLANRVIATALPADARDMPRLVSRTGMNVANAIEVIVRSTTMK